MISKLTYLTNSLYSQGLAAARAVEPTSDPLARLTRRTLSWLRQSDSWEIGSIVALRDLQRGLTVNKDAALAVSDSLVASGHFVQVESTVRHNRTVSVAYKIVSLDPEPVDRPQPVLIPVSSPNDHDDGPPPEPDEYLGADDFEGEP